MKKISKNTTRLFRKKRIRVKIKGTAKIPRLCVFRSNRAIYAQIIDDDSGKTLAAFSSQSLKSGNNDMKNAREVGKNIAQLAQKIKIEQAVYDRGGYRYHGRIKELAEGAREAGLKL